MKDQFKATIKVKDKTSTFHKSSDTVEGLIKLIKEHGLSVSNIVKISRFEVSLDKQRGRTKSKY